MPSSEETPQVHSTLDHSNPLSRRDFICLGLMGSGGLVLALSGCAPTNPIKDHLATVQAWLEAANGSDPAIFLKMHTDDISFYSYETRNAKHGQDQLWQAFQASAANHLEDAYVFGNQEMVCVQTVSKEQAISHCFVLLFQDELIQKIYQYIALYNISNDALIEKRAISAPDERLNTQIETVDRLTDALNARDIEAYLGSMHPSATSQGFLSIELLEGVGAIEGAARRFFEDYPNAQFRHYRTFGQGNLVCQQVIVEHGPVRTFVTVHSFEDGLITGVAEYFSQAKLIEI